MRGEIKPPVRAPIWINNEVGEGFMEGSNGGVDFLLKDEALRSD